MLKRKGKVKRNRALEKGKLQGKQAAGKKWKSDSVSKSVSKKKLGAKGMRKERKVK